jgi:acetyltransferase
LPNNLDVFFKPTSVAVIGATETTGHVGRAILWNLISSPFGGIVYPVNLKRKAVLGIRAFPSVQAIPDPVDLAVIITPAALVPNVIKECGEKGVRGAVIISAGFRETGPAGLELENQVLLAARRTNMRLIGPNCLGVMCPTTGLNATFAPSIAHKGSVALLSQSGAICTALLDWSLSAHVGFSALLSLGSMVDVGWGTLIDYLGNDPNTRSIVIYMESIGDVQSFLSAAREVALDKPILVLKAGRSEAAAKAAASHTGALAGSDAVLEAAFRRVGVLRIDDIGDIFQMTEVLSRQPRPAGPRLAIVTNAGGPGIIAADALIDLGEELATLTPETVDELNKVLPPHWSHANPIDVIGDAGADRYESAVRLAGKDAGTDGVLVIMTPQAMSDPVKIAESVAPFAKLGNKPILASWMGGLRAGEGEEILNKAGIPTFAFPDAAVRAFHYMWRYSYNLRALYETPEITADDPEAAQQATLLLTKIRDTGRTLLSEFEAKQLLEYYEIKTCPTVVADSADEAAKVAIQLGFPVVVKLHSLTVTHKTDVGGVKLSLPDAQAVRNAFLEIQTSVAEKIGVEHFSGVTVQPMISPDGYELIVGSTTDPQVGPVLLFGTGGQLVEVFRDRALALPPLNTVLARRFLERAKISKALFGVRGRPALDIGALENLLVRFSQLVVEHPEIKEIDINPLLASTSGYMALDARVVLHSKEITDLPKLAIRPYPRKYSSEVKLKDGTELTIRPIRPEDEPRLVHFHSALSEESVFKRYFAPMPFEVRTRHERLTRMCFIDYDRQMALIAQNTDQIIGVGRLIKLPFTQEAEVAAIVTDNFQRKGVGHALMNGLIQFATDEHLHLLRASVLVENIGMQKLLESHGFRFEEGEDPSVLEGERPMVN